MIKALIMSLALSLAYGSATAPTIQSSSEDMVIVADYCDGVKKDCHDGEDSVYRTCRASGGGILTCLERGDAYYRACLNGTGCSGY